MKKLLSISIAVLLALCLSVCVFAADEIEIPLDADHVGVNPAGEPYAVTVESDGISANEITLFGLNLPEHVAMGDTVVVHIKGTTDGDFRVWLLGAGETDEKGNESTFSNQWKASENNTTLPGSFEKYIELTAEDFDSQNLTEANRVAFKAPSYNSMLENFKLTYVGIVYGSVADLEADAVADAKPLADAAAAAFEKGKAATDVDGINTAIADVQTAVDGLAEKAESGFPGVEDLKKQVEEYVKELTKRIDAVIAEEALKAIQGDIDAVDKALTAATDANGDVAAIKTALDDAKAAVAKIDEAASKSDYKEVKAASKTANSQVSEIEKLLKDAEDAAAKAEAAKKAAEEQAAADAAKKKTTTIIIVVIVAVVVIAVIAVVALLGKKKK